MLKQIVENISIPPMKIQKGMPSELEYTVGKDQTIFEILWMKK